MPVTPTTANRGYQKPDPANKLNFDVARLVAALDAIDVDINALLTAAQTIAGVKTFSASPVIPTLAQTDNSTKAASTGYVNALVASSPAQLDTINELAAALGNDANFAATMTAALAAKADAAATTTALAGKAATGHTHTAGQVAGGPAFSAYIGATQSVSNGVATKIALNTETFDTDSAFDTTAFRFQPTLAGYYFFTGKLQGQASTAASAMSALIYKNGAALKQGPSYVAPAGQGMTCGVSGLVYLNGSTDYVELFGVNSGTGTNTFTAGATASYFDGYFVRA